MLSSTLDEGLLERGGLTERRIDKILKYEQFFYDNIICIFQESLSITLSSSSAIIISVCCTYAVVLDVDSVCCRGKERHQYHKVYARYEHK